MTEATRDQYSSTMKKPLDSSLSSASSRLQSAASSFEEGYKAAQERAREALTTSTDYVKGHPFSTVLGACAVGFVAGMIARRRRQ